MLAGFHALVPDNTKACIRASRSAFELRAGVAGYRLGAAASEKNLKIAGLEE